MILILKCLVGRAPVVKVGDQGFEPPYGLKVLKKQNVSSPLTRKK